MPFRLLSCLPALLLIAVLSACAYIPRPVAGVPPGAPWGALPLRNWLAEDRAEPLALAFCAPPECTPGLAIAVVRLKGRDADVTEALLKDPERLARAMRSPAGREKPVKAHVSVESLKESPFIGFTIILSPADGSKPPAYGAALGRRAGGELDVVLVIGEQFDAVRETALRVADRELDR